MRKRTLQQSTQIMKEQKGDERIFLHDLKQRIQRGDKCIVQKILQFGSCLKGVLNTGLKDQESLKL